MLDVIVPFHKKYVPPETLSTFKMQRLNSQSQQEMSQVKQNLTVSRLSNVTEIDRYLLDQTN